MSIGENMKKQRLALGMTLEEVAKKIGVSNATVSRWETGEIKAIGSDKIGALADILGTTTGYLLGRSNNLEEEPEKEVSKMNYELLGERVRKARGEMSLREFAKKCGISHTHLDSIEKGIDYRTGKPVSISYDTLLRIADGVGSSVTYLTGGEETKKTSRYYMPFPTRLRELLNRPEETQGKLAEAIGVQRQSIGQWKDGITSPDINALDKIADYYNVSTEYLLGRKSLDEISSTETLEKERGTLIGELRLLRKAVDEINNILDSLGVIK